MIFPVLLIAVAAIGAGQIAGIDQADPQRLKSSPQVISDLLHHIKNKSLTDAMASTALKR